MIHGTEAHTMVVDDIAIPTKLRLLVTRECNRNCPQCCNKSFDIDEIPVVNGVSQYDEIMLTGGEPMLDLEKLMWIIKSIRHHNPTARIYLYTAYLENPSGLLKVLNKIDGITLTLHDIED